MPYVHLHNTYGLQHLLLHPNHSLLGLERIPLCAWSLICCQCLNTEVWRTNTSYNLSEGISVWSNSAFLPMFPLDPYFGISSLLHLYPPNSWILMKSGSHQCNLVSICHKFVSKQFSTHISQSMNAYGCSLLLYSGITILIPKSLPTYVDFKNWVLPLEDFLADDYCRYSWARDS